jgi:hypothetical protein
MQNGMSCTKIIHICVLHLEDHKHTITLLSSKLLSQNTKAILYKVLIRLILNYWAAAHPMTSEVINVLRVFERKIVRQMYGPIKNNIRTNKDIRVHAIQRPDTVKFKKSL